jgi:hypothetical protein
LFVLGIADPARLRVGVKILATIATRAAAEGLPFLVIGGNAVIAYGYPRMTRDLDLLVREDDRRAWDALITSLGYQPHQIMRAFHMYNPGGLQAPAVDLMLVDAGTFGKLSADALTVTMAESSVQLPSLPHLIALKLHALRQGGAHRYERDLGDVITLLQVNHVDLATPKYREIVARYATPAILAEIERRLAGPQSAGA